MTLELAQRAGAAAYGADRAGRIQSIRLIGQGFDGDGSPPRNSADGAMMPIAEHLYVETSMTEPRDVAAELAHRIHADNEHFGGTMPEMTAISWRGYLAAMLEWNLISVAVYEELLTRIPAVKDDPAIAILTGRE
jgi:hypothetical protein